MGNVSLLNHANILELFNNMLIDFCFNYVEKQQTNQGMIKNLDFIFLQLASNQATSLKNRDRKVAIRTSTGVDEIGKVVQVVVSQLIETTHIVL